MSTSTREARLWGFAPPRKWGILALKTLKSGGGLGQKRGGSIDPLDPPILTGLDPTKNNYGSDRFNS